jgi:hypothetical protein
VRHELLFQELEEPLIRGTVAPIEDDHTLALGGRWSRSSWPPGKLSGQRRRRLWVSDVAMRKVIEMKPDAVLDLAFAEILE